REVLAEFQLAVRGWLAEGEELPLSGPLIQISQQVRAAGACGPGEVDLRHGHLRAADVVAQPLREVRALTVLVRALTERGLQGKQGGKAGNAEVAGVGQGGCCFRR